MSISTDTEVARVAQPVREAVAAWILRDRGLSGSSIEAIKEYRGETWLRALNDADTVLTLAALPSPPAPLPAGDLEFSIPFKLWADRIENTTTLRRVQEATPYRAAADMAIIDCFYDFEAKRLVALLRALASPSSSQIAGDVRGAFIQGVREALVEKCARIVEHWTPSMWLVDVDKAGIASEIRALAFGDGCPEPSKEKP